MHPNPAYRSDDRLLLDTLIDAVGFGMVFAATLMVRALPMCRC